MADGVTVTNKSSLEAYRVHTKMAAQVSVEVSGGGEDHKIWVSCSSTNPLAADIQVFLESPTMGTITVNDSVTGIAIPASTGKTDLGFFIDQRAMMDGDVSSVEYSLQLTDSADSDVGSPDTFTIPLAKNYDDLGVKDKNQIMIGAGKLLMDFKDLGFYTDDGIEVVPIQELKKIKSGAVAGNLGAASVIHGYNIKATLMQNTCRQLLDALNLTGSVRRSTNIQDFGGTRSGEYIDLAPQSGWLKSFSLQVEGHSPAYDDKDIGFNFHSVSVINAGSIMLQASTELLIPVEFEAWIDPNAANPTFGKYYVLDKE